jgi:ankyrin repeat protein
LQRGADVNHQDDIGASPLSRAAAEGEHEVVRILVEASATLDAQDEKGRTALFWAAKKGHSNVAKVLIDNGANLNLTDNEWGRTALHFAIERENVEVAKLLITAGAPLDIKDGEGRVPLSYAAEQGLEDVVTLLVEKGADVNMPDDTEDDGMWDTMVPLSWAAANGNEAVIRILLAHHASVNPDIEGRPPLMHAFQEEKDEAMKVLLEHGADPFGGDFSDECVLRGVAKCGLKDTVELCLKQKARSVEVKQESIWWALVEASHNDHAEVVELLLQQNPFSFPIADLTPWDLAEDKEVLSLLQPYQEAIRKRVEQEEGTNPIE